MSNRFLGGLYLLVIWRWPRLLMGGSAFFVRNKPFRLNELAYFLGKILGSDQNGATLAGSRAICAASRARRVRAAISAASTSWS